MKSGIFRILCAVLSLAVCVVISGCAKDAPNDEETTPPAETEAETEAAANQSDEIVYVSLGDSIAEGYGLANLQTEAYSAVIAEKFKADGKTCAAYNFGVAGQKSDGLITYINAVDEITDKIAEADFVSISIGANNILSAASSFIGSYNDFKLNPSTLFTSDDITAAFKEFNENTAAGLELLRGDIPTLIDLIRSCNEDCTIIFITCYNPYEAVKVTLDWGGPMTVDFAALSDSCVIQMNSIITEFAEDQGYKVADVYSAFSGKAARLINATPVDSGDAFNPSEIDPHPNKTGHSQIASVIYQSMTEE